MLYASIMSFISIEERLLMNISIGFYTLPVRFCVVALCMLLLAVPLHAQEDDEDATQARINIGQTVTDTITDAAIFDRFTFAAVAGDTVRATMAASDGLAPLLGIADGGGDVIVRTDTDANGDPLPPAEPDATVDLTFPIPEDGEYTLVASRMGTDTGTTSGSYTLTLERVEDFMVGVPDETFTCGEVEATTIVSLRLNAESERHRISVYGTDDFQPVISTQWGSDDIFEDCTTDSGAVGGDVVTFPGADAAITYEADSPNAAQFTLQGGRIGNMIVNIGSVGGGGGRFMIVVEGFAISTRQQSDLIEAYPGPAMVESGFDIYMVKTGVDRLDPQLELRSSDRVDEQICDDAGFTGCESMTPFDGAGTLFSDGQRVLGDRFSAGVRVVAPSDELVAVTFDSRAQNATGSYAVVVTGALAPPMIGPAAP